MLDGDNMDFELCRLDLSFAKSSEYSVPSIIVAALLRHDKHWEFQTLVYPVPYAFHIEDTRGKMGKLLDREKKLRSVVHLRPGELYGGINLISSSVLLRFQIDGACQFELLGSMFDQKGDFIQDLGRSVVSPRMFEGLGLADVVDETGEISQGFTFNLKTIPTELTSVIFRIVPTAVLVQTDGTPQKPCNVNIQLINREKDNAEMCTYHQASAHPKFPIILAMFFRRANKWQLQPIGREVPQKSSHDVISYMKQIVKVGVLDMMSRRTQSRQQSITSEIGKEILPRSWDEWADRKGVLERAKTLYHASYSSEFSFDKFDFNVGPCTAVAPSAPAETPSQAITPSSVGTPFAQLRSPSQMTVHDFTMIDELFQAPAQSPRKSPPKTRTPKPKTPRLPTLTAPFSGKTIDLSKAGKLQREDSSSSLDTTGSDSSGSLPDPSNGGFRSRSKGDPDAATTTPISNAFNPIPTISSNDRAAFSFGLKTPSEESPRLAPWNIEIGSPAWDPSDKSTEAGVDRIFSLARPSGGSFLRSSKSIFMEKSPVAEEAPKNLFPRARSVDFQQ